MRLDGTTRLGDHHGTRHCAAATSGTRIRSVGVARSSARLCCACVASHRALSIRSPSRSETNMRARAQWMRPAWRERSSDARSRRSASPSDRSAALDQPTVLCSCTLPRSPLPLSSHSHRHRPLLLPSPLHRHTAHGHSLLSLSLPFLSPQRSFQAPPRCTQCAANLRVGHCR